jgi:radical SAM superfamily enzyme YgiQ (UPF0313 family)
MKINFLCVEDALIAIGFRKMAAVMKAINSDTNIFYVPLSRRTSFRNRVLSIQQDNNSSKWAIEIATAVSDADIVAFSSMSDYADLVKLILKEVKTLNPDAFTVWGGAHPIIAPEQAIEADVDAICTGEGEHAFPELVERLKQGHPYMDVQNFWFKTKTNEIVKTRFRPLSSNSELAELPLLDYASDREHIYEAGKGFTKLTKSQYLLFSGLGYNTVFSIGCPFRCTYCGNTKFISNDKNYTQIRHPGVDYLIRELEQAIEHHPHIGSIVFHDDSFMALPNVVLEEFAEKYKKKIDIPFAVFGVIPNFVKDEKFKILMSAGLNRVRMGIQSGSGRILEFYRRPSPPEKIFSATSIIGHYLRYMIPPAYDIIVDNPIETKEDIRDTLKLVYNLPRPFTLNIFSLRVMPNTDMATQFEELGVDQHGFDMVSEGYLTLTPTLANALLYLLCIIKPPRFLFELWLSKCLPAEAPQQTYPLLNTVLRTGYLTRRGIDHLWHMDFSVLPGRFGFFLWNAKIIYLWRKYCVRRYTADYIPKRRHISPS